MGEEGACWRVRVRGAGGVLGAGIVVSSNEVLTCAHVVSAGSGDRQVPPTPPPGALTLDFPGRADGTDDEQRAARPVAGSWWPSEDCALLAMDRPAPAGVTVAELSTRTRYVDAPVRAFGHPRGADDGIWSRGTLAGRGGPRPSWLQFDGRDQTGRPVERGFSGAGVLDGDDRVIGMVVAADRSAGARVAWMIPAATLLRLLGRPAEQPDGRADQRAGPGGAGARPAGGPLPWEDAVRLAEALYAVPVMQSDATRQQILQTLSPGVAAAIPRFNMSLMDLFSTVRTCLDRPGALTELVRAVRAFGGPESVAVARLDELINELGLDGA
jgi:hypothetical protein